MTERVRIEHYEAEDVRRLVDEYHRYIWRSGVQVRAEDLVNAIGEIYETALARRNAKVNDQLAEAIDAD